jgi:uncharacterized protein (DUF1800 family)
MALKEAAIACNRFGLGARPGELDRASADPKGWLRAQLRAAPQKIASADGATRLAEYFAARKAGDAGLQKQLRGEIRQRFLSEAGARTLAAAGSDNSFYERMVQFWSNHFTVSVQRPVILGMVVPFEDEAIRPHVAGTFVQMLTAVVRHPAMLLYLDNAQSIGPNSRAGQRRERGLNENLARELLELHTLGVDGGYAQDDVRELARILTGWTVQREAEDGRSFPGTRTEGGFRWLPQIHEPGDKKLLGQTIAEGGEQEGIRALTLLALHPSTARHIATKFARHFVADAPPPALVARLAASFRETGGNLSALAETLLTSPEAWQSQQDKVKSPNELVISALRAIGAPAGGDAEAAGKSALGGLQLLGQVPFSAPSPKGWPDSAADWIGPEAMVNRVDWALAFGNRVARSVEPQALLASTIAPAASAATSFHIAHAPSVAEAVALLIASPEFQRR